MNWDLEVLRNKRNILTTKMLNCQNEEEKEELKKEALIFSDMIESITCSAINKMRHNPKIEIKEETTNKKCQFFKNALPEIALNSSILEYSKKLPMYFFTKSKISEEEYLKIVEGFLSTFKLDLQSLYNEMYLKQKINVSKRDFFKSLGICYYFPSLGESYINVTNNSTVNDAVVLPHELGHAYLLNGSNYEQKYNMITSSLGESFPMFIQLAFYDYLKSTKYFKNAINMERNFLENLTSVYEMNSELYIHADNVKNIDNRFINSYHKIFSENSANYFLSKILAYYLINLYRNNNMDKILEFAKAYKEGTEYEFFKNISNRLFLESLKSEYDYFYQSIREHKKLVKNK